MPLNTTDFNNCDEKKCSTSSGVIFNCDDPCESGAQFDYATGTCEGDGGSDCVFPDEPTSLVIQDITFVDGSVLRGVQSIGGPITSEVDPEFCYQGSGTYARCEDCPGCAPAYMWTNYRRSGPQEFCTSPIRENKVIESIQVTSQNDNFCCTPELECSDCEQPHEGNRTFGCTKFDGGPDEQFFQLRHRNDCSNGSSQLIQEVGQVLETWFEKEVRPLQRDRWIFKVRSISNGGLEKVQGWIATGFTPEDSTNCVWQETSDPEDCLCECEYEEPSDRWNVQYTTLSGDPGTAGCGTCRPWSSTSFNEISVFYQGLKVQPVGFASFASISDACPNGPVNCEGTWKEAIGVDHLYVTNVRSPGSDPVACGAAELLFAKFAVIEVVTGTGAWASRGDIIGQQIVSSWVGAIGCMFQQTQGIGFTPYVL